MAKISARSAGFTPFNSLCHLYCHPTFICFRHLSCSLYSEHVWPVAFCSHDGRYRAASCYLPASYTIFEILSGRQVELAQSFNCRPPWRTAQQPHGPGYRPSSRSQNRQVGIPPPMSGLRYFRPQMRSGPLVNRMSTMKARISSSCYRSSGYCSEDQFL